MGDLDPEFDNDHYAILRIDKNANTTKIKMTYRSLEKLLKSEEEKIKAQLAYSVLVNPTRRLAYDMEQERRTAFNLFFANEMIKEHVKKEEFVRKEGVNQFADVHASLREVFTGTQKELAVEVVTPCWECFDTCDRCRGAGSITGFVMMTTGVQHRQEAKCPRCSGKGYARVFKEEAEAPEAEPTSTSEAAPTSTSEAAPTSTSEALEAEPVSTSEAVPTCSTCRSTYAVKETRMVKLEIPIGAETGKTWTFPGLGEQIPHGTPGDFIVRLVVDPCEDLRITRHGEHLKAKLRIPFVSTIVGKDYEFALPTGELMKFHTSIFEEVLNPGRLYIIKEKGMQLSDGKRGSLLVHFDIDYASCKIARSHEAMDALAVALNKVLV